VIGRLAFSEEDYPPLAEPNFSLHPDISLIPNIHFLGIEGEHDSSYKSGAVYDPLSPIFYKLGLEFQAMCLRGN
jgi:hypothetical protein